MTTQVGFYADADDQFALLEQAQRLDLRAIPATRPSDEGASHAAPVDFDPPADDRCFYLVPEALVPEAIYVEFEDEPDWSGLNQAGSPVIEFEPSQRVDHRIHNGRLYLELDEEDQFYDQVLRHFERLEAATADWARTTRYGFRVGPHTARRAREGELELAHHRLVLQLQPED